MKKEKLSLRGISLIELTVVIALIAVMSIVSAVSFSKLTGDRLTADARKIVNDLCWARQLAVATHQDYIIAFAATNYAIYRGSVALSNQLKTQNLNTGVSLSVAPPLPAQLTFNFPQGTTQNKTITLTSQEKTKIVAVYANTGYVKIQ